MNRSPLCFSLSSGVPLLAAALLLLGGCSPAQDSASPASVAAAQARPQSQVAVARGKIDVEGGLLDLASPAAGVVQQLLIKVRTQKKTIVMMQKLKHQNHCFVQSQALKI